MTNCPKCGKQATESLSLTKGEHDITANMEEAEINSELIILEITCPYCQSLFAYTTMLTDTELQFANEIKLKE